MELCGLPKARPIVWSDCPAFQRHHRSVICAAESLTRFPWAIDTTSEKKIYIRWCCTDLLRPPAKPVNTSASGPQSLPGCPWELSSGCFEVKSAPQFSRSGYHDLDAQKIQALAVKKPCQRSASLLLCDRKL